MYKEIRYVPFDLAWKSLLTFSFVARCLWAVRRAAPPPRWWNRTPPACRRTITTAPVVPGKNLRPAVWRLWDPRPENAAVVKLFREFPRHVRILCRICICTGLRIWDFSAPGSGSRRRFLIGKGNPQNFSFRGKAKKFWNFESLSWKHYPDPQPWFCNSVYVCRTGDMNARDPWFYISLFNGARLVKYV